MRSSILGLAAATAVGISVVALPPALAAHSTSSAVHAVSAVAVPSAASLPDLPALPGATGSYPTNTTAVSISPTSKSFPGPVTATFTGRLALNGHGIRTDHLRIFSVKKAVVVATLKTTTAGVWTVKLKVNSSDWFFAMYSGSQSYQPALSAISRITIGNRPAVQ